jgi:thiol-disulfide isomerase/thioredoxin
MRSVKPIDRILRGALAVLLVTFVAVVAWAVYEKPIHVVVAGEQAPPFRVTAENGRAISAAGFGGKLLVLNFWATWCPPCVVETPSLSQFAQDYAGRGVVVLAISVDANEQAYRAFLAKYRPAFLTVRDALIHRDYGTFMYPETYIIDSTGRVVQKIDFQADLVDSSGKVVQKVVEEGDWSTPGLRAYIDSLL